MPRCSTATWFRSRCLVASGRRVVARGSGLVRAGGEAVEVGAFEPVEHFRGGGFDTEMLIERLGVAVGVVGHPLHPAVALIDSELDEVSHEELADPDARGSTIAVLI